jgi:hypothetical protein
MQEQAPTAAVEAREDTRVAVLLAVAAIVAAGLGAHATLLSSRAAGKWQGAVRLQVRNGALGVNDTAYAFTEVPLATLAAAHRLEAQQLEATGEPTLVGIGKAIEGGLSLPANEAPYVRADGSFDLARRLVDLRRSSAPEAADVPRELRVGDRDAHHAWLVGIAILPAALAFLAAASAKALPRMRRPALVLSVLLLVCALAVEVVSDL